MRDIKFHYHNHYRLPLKHIPNNMNSVHDRRLHRISCGLFLLGVSTTTLKYHLYLPIVLRSYSPYRGILFQIMCNSCRLIWFQQESVHWVKELEQDSNSPATVIWAPEHIPVTYDTQWTENAGFLINRQQEHRGADKSLARPGRKQATATEDFDVHIFYL
jgi:hypothetical protein